MTDDNWSPPAGTADTQAIEWLSDIKAHGDRHQAEFEAWYAQDPAHADAFDALLDSWDKTALIGLTEEGRARLPRRREDARRVGWVRYGLAAAAAAVLAVAVAAGVHSFSLGGGGVASAELASRTGELRSVTLSDGSRVTLDTDTLLRTDFTDGERRVQLDHGRARFEVAHDAVRPFIVAADGGSVTAHGTVFDVAYIGGRMRVGLLKGSVEVRKRSGGASGARLLAPGQGMTFPESSTSLPLPHALPSAETAWTTGMLTFANTPLVEAVAEANRYSTSKIVLAQGPVEQLRVTGRFPASDIKGLASGLASSFNLSIAQDSAGNERLGSQTPQE